MQKVILYTGNFLFPDGNAAGKRVLGNVKALQEVGYKVVCVCFRKERMHEGILVSDQEGVIVYTIPYAQGIRRMDNGRALRIFKKALHETSKSLHVHAVIMYGTLGTALYNVMIMRICRKKNIKIVYDMVDLFDKPLKNNILRYIIKRIDVLLLMNYVLPQCDQWIAISTYLKARMPDPSKTIVIPPLAIQVQKSNIKNTTQPTTFSYASLINEKNIPVSDWKDRVDSIIDAFYGLYIEHKRDNFRVNFVGFTAEQLLEQFPIHQREDYKNKLAILSQKITFYGRLSNKDSQEIIKQCDFTILLRDSKTCTNAGFPTKVSESLSLGIPVVANATSDIAVYVHDGVNGFEVPAPNNLPGIIEKLSTILELTREQKDNMRSACGAEQPFYYMNYVIPLKEFLK